MKQCHRSEVFRNIQAERLPEDRLKILAAYQLHRLLVRVLDLKRFEHQLFVYLIKTWRVIDSVSFPDCQQAEQVAVCFDNG